MRRSRLFLVVVRRFGRSQSLAVDLLADERVSFGSRASDASSIHLFAGRTRRLYLEASPFSPVFDWNLLRPYLLLLNLIDKSCLTLSLGHVLGPLTGFIEISHYWAFYFVRYFINRNFIFWSKMNHLFRSDSQNNN